jgi:hypothetical protein
MFGRFDDDQGGTLPEISPVETVPNETISIAARSPGEETVFIAQANLAGRRAALGSRFSATRAGRASRFPAAVQRARALNPQAL